MYVDKNMKKKILFDYKSQVWYYIFSIHEFLMMFQNCVLQIFTNKKSVSSIYFSMTHLKQCVLIKILYI